jgi:beta-phosphoglucomutase-like phosphatase (HAD superfamily)
LYAPYLRPTSGLLAFLDKLKAENIKLAVGTSAPVSNVILRSMACHYVHILMPLSTPE